jgi:hypothetical protein
MLPKTLLFVLLLSGSAFAATPAPKGNPRDFAAIPPAQRLKTICALANDIVPSLKDENAGKGIVTEFRDIQLLACASRHPTSN